MHWIHQWLHHGSLPILSAFLLGFITSISPCPLATNITVIAFLSRELKNKKKVFYNGLIYMLGGAISYATLGILFFFGASQFQIAGFLQRYGWRVIGPVLIVSGLLMLDVIKIKFLFSGSITDKINLSSAKNEIWKALLMGFVFALAFCPYTGVLFFGMLIPMTISSISGLYLPIVFAIGAGLPVVLISYVLAFAFSGVGDFYHRFKNFEHWFRRVVAIIFIGAGIFYVIQYF